MEPVHESKSNSMFVFAGFSVTSYHGRRLYEPVVLSLPIPFLLSAKCRRALFSSSASGQ